MSWPALLDGLAVGDWTGTLLSYVCNAVNERRDGSWALGTKRAWPIDGGTSTTPLPNDFSRLAFDSDEVREILSEARGDLELLATTYFNTTALHPLFTSPAASQEFMTWARLAPTVSSWLDSLGYGSTWVSPERVQSFDMWAQLKEAISSLKYVPFDTGRIPPQSTPFGDLLRGGGVDFTADGAWADLISDPESLVNRDYISGFNWFFFGGPIINGYAADRLSPSASSKYGVAWPWFGIPASRRIHMLQYQTLGTTTTGDVSIESSRGFSFTVPSGTSATTEYVAEEGANPDSAGVSYDLITTVTTATPVNKMRLIVTPPFTTPAMRYLIDLTAGFLFP